MGNTPLTAREQNIIEQLETLWKLPDAVSPDTLKLIIEMLLHFQEPFKTIGLQKIAEYSVSTLNLHMLSLLALFQQKAVEEGISLQEQMETLEQVNPEVFRLLTSSSKNLSFSSLDDLVMLSNIVLSLQTLSQTESAQEAQSWLYDLPAMCFQQLTQEHLLIDPQKVTFTFQEGDTSIMHPVYPAFPPTMSEVHPIKLNYLPVSQIKSPTFFFVPTEMRQGKSNLPYTA